MKYFFFTLMGREGGCLEGLDNVHRFVVVFLKASLILVKYWANILELSGKYWANIGQILGKHWANIGQIFDKYLTNIGQLEFQGPSGPNSSPCRGLARYALKTVRFAHSVRTHRQTNKVRRHTDTLTD